MSKIYRLTLTEEALDQLVRIIGQNRYVHNNKEILVTGAAWDEDYPNEGKYLNIKTTEFFEEGNEILDQRYVHGNIRIFFKEITND